MDKPRTCPRCAAPLVAAPLSFTVAFVCPNGRCGRVFARPQDTQRVTDELTLQRGRHLIGRKMFADTPTEAGPVPRVLEHEADREIPTISDLPMKRAA